MPIQRKAKRSPRGLGEVVLISRGGGWARRVVSSTLDGSRATEHAQSGR